MIDLRFRPLKRWISEKTPATRRKRAGFSTPYVKLLDRLERELRYLSAKNAIVEAGFRDNQIRNDGWPFGGASPSEPGIILSFDSKHGPLSLPCDYFLTWTLNLHAIMLHLEHLRLATAYGVGEHGEQYRGWKALPSPGGENSLEQFAQRIVEMSGLTGYTAEGVLGNYDHFRLLYRAAAKRVHPDAQHADADLWNKLQEAERIIDQAFTGKAAGS